MFDMAAIQSLIVTHLWQSVLLAALLAVILIAGRRMLGRTRYAIAATAFAAAIVLPLAAFAPREAVIDRVAEWTASFAAPQAEASVTTTTAAVEELAAGEASLRSTLVGAVLSGIFRDVSSAPVAAEAASAPAPAAWRLPDMTAPFLAVWVLVTFILMARIVRDVIAVERLAAGACSVVLPASLAKRLRGVRVAVSPEAPGPMAAGLLRPCIILPETLTHSLHAPGVAALLEHERAHIERRDVLVALAQRIVVALLWWSPAMHWISRRMDEEREVACDESAVERTGDARAFARSLTTQAENQLWARAPRLAVGAIGPRSHFSRRVRRLIAMATSGMTASRYSGRIAFSALVLCAGVAFVATPGISADTPKEDREDRIEAARARAPVAPVANSWLQLAQVVTPPAPVPAPLAPLPPSPESAQERPPAPSRPPAPPRHDGDYAGLAGGILAEVEWALAGLGPELAAGLAGLDAELAGLGEEIAMLVNSELMRELPLIMEEVRLALQEAELHGDFDREEFQREMQEAREELRNAFGPQFREELRRSLDEARVEIQRERENIRRDMLNSQGEIEAARRAMEAAREEMRKARERGEIPTGYEFEYDSEYPGQLMIRISGDK